jgi:transcriptional regulator with XRE-family HTH domain
MGRRAKNPVDVHVGRRLRLGRRNRGLSRKELGVLIGKGAGAVDRFENGLSSIRAVQLLDLSRVLGVDMSFFFDGLAASAASSLLVPGGAAVEETSRFIDAYFAIDDPGVRHRLFKLIKAAAG